MSVSTVVRCVVATLLNHFLCVGATSTTSSPSLVSSIVPHSVQTTVCWLWHQWLAPTLHLEPFQQALLSVCVCILCVTVVLVLFAWRVYGRRIVHCFTSPHVELLLSSEFHKKLPNEYCPKY